MSFQDIFKKSFISSYQTGQMDLTAMILTMGIVCLLGVYLFFAHRFLTRRQFYNKNFGIALAVLAIITASVILTIQSSIVISLGMVGALSIVRFRTAVKDPMDLVFLFWSISTGIICGAGLYVLAILVAVTATAAIYVLELAPVTKAPMLLILHFQDQLEEDRLWELIGTYSKYYKVKSRNRSRGQVDLVVEVSVKDDRGLVNEVSALAGMESAALLSHDGETTY